MTADLFSSRTLSTNSNNISLHMYFSEASFGCQFQRNFHASSDSVTSLRFVTDLAGYLFVISHVFSVFAPKILQTEAAATASAPNKQIET